MKWKLGDVRHISLRWKLLIPFLFLPAALIVTLVAWGIHSQNEILSHQEQTHMRDHFHQFLPAPQSPRHPWPPPLPKWCH